MSRNNFQKFRFFLLVSFILTLALPLPFLNSGFAKEAQAEQFHTAAKAFSDGFYDASFSLFQRFVKDFPNSPLTIKAKLYLAKCQYYKQDYLKALKIISTVDSSPGAADILDELYYWLSIIYFKGNNFDKAVSYAKRVLNDYPDSEFRWPSYYLLAQSHQGSGNFKAAKDVFLTIVSDSSSGDIIQDAYLQLFQLYLDQRSYPQLLSLGKKYLKKFPHGLLKARLYFYLGECYYAQGNWNKAQNNYQRALRVNPDREFLDLVYQRLGFTYIQKGNSLEAKITIDKIRDKALRLYSQGTYYFKSNDYLQALETFEMFIRDYSQSGLIDEAYLSKADILYELGRLNDAIYAYQYILDNFPAEKSPEVTNKAHYGIAWSYLKNGKFKKAIDEFKDTLANAHNSVVKVSSQIHIADAYQEIGKYTEALGVYSDILKNYPNTMYADYIQFQIGLTFLKKKDLEKAFLALKNLKNNFSSSKLVPQAQYYLAVGYFSQADYSEAKSLLEDFTAKFPRHDLIAKVRYLYGKCFFNEKDYQKALRVFKDIVGKFRDRDVEELIRIDIGVTYLHLSLNEAAKKIWVKFLKKYPQSQYRASVLLYLGGLYEKEGNFIEAEKNYRKIISKDKDSSRSNEAMLALGHLYWNRNDLETAEEYFQTLAKQQSPIALKSKLYLAKVFTQSQKYEQALTIYDELSEDDSPIAKVAYLEKAFILKEMKLYSEAITMFKKAINSGIDTQKARFSLGVCLEKAGKTQAAVEQYFKAIYNFPADAFKASESPAKDYKTKSFFRIARIYERENNIAEAKKIYQKIIGLAVEESKIAQVRLKELGVK